MSVQLTAYVTYEGTSTGEFRFDLGSQPIIKIGTLSSAHIKIDEVTASRVHAVIELKGNQTWLMDMGSTTGTLVNGRKVNRVQLNNGDSIVIGGSEIKIQINAPGMAVQPPVTATSAQPSAAPAAPAAPSTPVTPSVPVAPVAPTSQVNPVQAVPVTPAQVAPATNYTQSAMPVSAYQTPNTAAQHAPMQPQPLSEGNQPEIINKVAFLSPENVYSVEQYIDFLIQKQTGKLSASIPEDDNNPYRYSGYTEDLVVKMQQRNKKRMTTLGIITAIVIVGIVIFAIFAGKEPAQEKKEIQQVADDQKVQPEKEITEPKDEKNFLYYKLANEMTTQQVAEQVYTNAARVQVIVEANNNIQSATQNIPAGSEIKIPRFEEYTIASGDTLGGIAKKMLGQPLLYEKIYQANTDVLPSPSAVEVGMKLKIPLLK